MTGEVDSALCSWGWVAQLANGRLSTSTEIPGELITVAAEAALRECTSLLLVTASGGARMQEGALSLMQMVKTSQALGQLDRAAIVTISLVTDPTYGGVAASFATLTDVILAVDWLAAYLGEGDRAHRRRRHRPPGGAHARLVDRAQLRHAHPSGLRRVGPRGRGLGADLRQRDLLGDQPGGVRGHPVERPDVGTEGRGGTAPGRAAVAGRGHRGRCHPRATRWCVHSMIPRPVLSVSLEAETEAQCRVGIDMFSNSTKGQVGGIRVVRDVDGPARWRAEGAIRAEATPTTGLVAAQCQPGCSVSECIEELWGNTPPTSAMATLQTYVMQLRKGLGDPPRTCCTSMHRLLVTMDRGYLFTV